MKIDRIYNIYFSATLTTEKVVRTMSDEISELSGLKVVNYNFAYPEKRKSFPKIKTRDLVIFGMPTYAGRLPNLMLDYLDTIEGNGALTVPVVTFGNRAYENSLMELRNILETHDFHTFAAGAFSCEHSFSTILGGGRPDTEDIKDIRTFAKAVYEKIQKMTGIPDMVNVYGDLDKGIEKSEDKPAEDTKNSKGYFQPKNADNKPIDMRKAKPKTNDMCTGCGLCAKICPMGSVNPENPKEVTGKCIKCCACVKRCPAKAKFFDDEGFMYHKNNLEELYSRERADNIVFI